MECVVKLPLQSYAVKKGFPKPLYYKWSKDFMEAGKRRLNGDTMREANTSEVKELKDENRSLKNRDLKKNLNGED